MKNTDKVDISQEQINQTFQKYQNEAEEIVKDKSKLQNLIKNSKAKIRKLKKLPFIGAVINDYIDLIDLLVAYTKGEYKSIPVSILVSIVTALLYVILPIDIISDAIPVLGFIDDAMVITFACSIARLDLEKFRKYRLDKEYKELKGLIKTFFDRDEFHEPFMQAIVLDDAGEVKALFSYENEEISPLVCTMYVSTINLEEFSSLEIVNDFVNAFRKLFFECSLQIKNSSSFKIYDAKSFEEHEDNYVITEKNLVDIY